MKTTILFAIVFLMPFVSFSQDQETAESKKGLIKIAIMYPSEEGKSFDMEYYASSHMPMCVELFGDAIKDMKIDKGLSGRTPADPLPYVAIGYFFFDSIEAWQQAFGPNAEKILGDIPNYTDIQPTVMISEVLVD